MLVYHNNARTDPLCGGQEGGWFQSAAAEAPPTRIYFGDQLMNERQIISFRQPPTAFVHDGVEISAALPLIVSS